MKKIFFSVLAIAAIAACTKSEVQYDAPGEISFAPATKNVTKAAIEGGTLVSVNPSQTLGVWAFWNYNSATNTVTGKTGAISEDIVDANNENYNPYSAYSVEYLDNALFVNRSGNQWGGQTPYPWPTNGALVFAGYTTPTAAETADEDYKVDFTLDDNSMVFTNYTQSLNPNSTFDLCWFGATSSSYDRKSPEVPVTLSHALTWITFKIKAKDGDSMSNNWSVTNVTLNDIKNVGTGTCVGTTTGTNSSGNLAPAVATWEFANDAATAPMEIFNDTTNPQPISTSATDIEKTPRGTVIIPQEATSVTVSWTYTVQGNPVNESMTIKLDGNWSAGIHYTYTIEFDGNEILIQPEYAEWATASSSDITVE